MNESHLLPVIIKKESKRQHSKSVSDSTNTQKKKMCKDDIVDIPRSLFDRPCAAILKMRREARLRKLKGLMVGASSLRKPVSTSASLNQPPILVNRPASDKQDESEWLISEDYAILQVIQDLQGIHPSLIILIPGHTPNWDLVADAVNTVSRVYRSAEDCKARFVNVIMRREKGKIISDNKPKKPKGICKRKNYRPMKTSHLHQQDNNAAYTNIFLKRCKTVMELAQKHKAQAEGVKIQTRLQKISKGLLFLNDYGINYDEPLSPMEIADNRQERLRQGKRKNELIRAQSMQAAVAAAEVPTRNVVQVAEHPSGQKQVQQLPTVTRAASLMQAAILSLSQAQQLQLNRHRNTMSALEDCALDTFDNDSRIILPNSVQLIESELPLSEAANREKLQGIYLFRQFFSYNSNTLQCLFCHNKYSSRLPEELKKHYNVIHELTVNIHTAEFDENTVFICVPSDVNELTTVNSLCQFCDTTLQTLTEIRDHYPNAHNRTVRLFSEFEIADIGNFFNCGFCNHASTDFSSHHQHMKVMHRMQTYVCPYCTYCTPKLNRLKTHVKHRHLQDQSGSHFQFSVYCSVYVHEKDGLMKHMVSNIPLIGNGNFNQLDRYNFVNVFSQTAVPMGNEDFRQPNRKKCLDVFSQTKQRGIWELQHHLNEILLNGNVSDVVLRVEGRKFKVHKCILAARSPVFSVMMMRETKEKNTDIVDIKNVDPGLFLDFLSYLYTGSMENITSENAVELYTVANKYQVYELENVCVDCMLKNITINNFCDILTLSLQHGEKDLTDACAQFFIKNYLFIVLTLKWQIFLGENPVLSSMFIKQLQMKNQK